jgi:hypothetical protein
MSTGQTERAAADPRDVAAGAAFAAYHAGVAAGRMAMLPGRLALRAPVLGHFLRRAGDDLAADGRRAQVWARASLERATDALISAPELERALDRALAGQLTDAVARSLAEHRVVERVAAQVVASTDVDRVVVAVLDDERTERALERVLASPEMDRLVGYIASSPQVVDAVSRHTQTLADEMVADVRRRSQSVDDIAERTVRGWLRRPRPSPS